MQSQSQVQQNYPELTKLYLKENPLTKQFIDSYVKFIEEGMQKVIDSQPIIEPQIQGMQLKLGKIRVEKPMITEADGSRRPLYPMEARMRDLSYTAPLFLEMTLVIKGVEKRTEDVFIGEIPVMVKSKICYLYGKTQEELIKAGEDPMDQGGYFIINGTEKSLMTLEDLAPNRILVSRDKAKGSVEAKVFSTRMGFRGRCTVERTSEGKIAVSMPSYSKTLEIILVLKALGFDKTDKILEAFSDDAEVKNDVLLNLEVVEAKNKSEALEVIGRRAAPGQPVDYQVRRAELLLDHYLFPHIGVDDSTRLAKAFYLCRMAERAIKVAYGKRVSESKDHYANKRLKISGKLMEELFKYGFQFLVKDISYQIERANVRGRKLSMFVVVRPDALTDRIKYAFATGNWVGGHTGVCQPIDKYNYISSLSFLRRVTSPLAKKHPHHKARDLHGTHFGRLDPNETPEGPNCGLVKNLALFCEVTNGAGEKQVEDALKQLGISIKMDKSSVYINGRFMGFNENGEKLAKELREKRRQGQLDAQVNVAFYSTTEEVFINTDEGRARRPLLVVKNNKPMLTDVHIQKVNSGELTWTSLVKQGVIEYLDSEEEENTFIAMSIQNLENMERHYTHLEIDPSAILGFASSQVPFTEYNMAPRVLMASQHTKQSLGLYASNFNLRSETRGYLLYYPQRPLVQTDVYDSLGIYRRSSGQNFVVAVLSYAGHNMNDAIVLNKSAIDRGLGRSVFLRTYENEERRYPGGQRDNFEVPQEFVQGYLGPEAYSKLDVTGLISPEEPASANGVLIGKTSPPRFLKEINALDV